ncbi:outer membrane lipoprotein YcfJ|nr:outer membrane lipoprotein YcfJ [Candidatus Pantoea persica]
MDVFDHGPQYAQVLSATPIKESIKQPRQGCRNVTLIHRRPVPNEDRITGSVLGAVAGGYAGNQVQGSMQSRDTYTTSEQRCKTVFDKQEKMMGGYDVTYKQGKIRMENDLGTRIPLDRNGQLILNNN